MAAFVGYVAVGVALLCLIVGACVVCMALYALGSLILEHRRTR